MTRRAGLKKENILKISENVRNPSENVPESSVYLRQPSLIFGNLRKSLDDLRQSSVIFRSLGWFLDIFGNLRKSSDKLRNSWGNLLQSLVIFGRLRVNFGYFRNTSDDLRMHLGLPSFLGLTSEIFVVICTGVTLFALVLHFLQLCYTWTALLLANQNRVIFWCIL